MNAQSLPSGGSVAAGLVAGQADTYSITATDGDTIFLSSSAAFNAVFTVFNPDGSLFATDTNNLVARTVESGTYRVIYQASSILASGPYTIHYANSRTANELGPLASGGAFDGELIQNDIESFTLTATNGDTIFLSSSAAFNAVFTVFNPDGSLFATNTNNLVESTVQSGVYRIVYQGSSTLASGPYTIHYANSRTANELGPLASGAAFDGQLTQDDIDSFTLTATNGDRIVLSSSAAFNAVFTVFNPDGSLFATNTNNLDEGAVQSGTYRVIYRPSPKTSAWGVTPLRADARSNGRQTPPV